MSDEAATVITCRPDLDHAHGYESFQDLVDLLDDQTDLEVEIEVDDTMLTIAQGRLYDNAYNAMSFVYPFDLQDAIDWTYFFENDYTVRLEIVEDVDRLLADRPYNSEDDPVLAFVREALMDDWVAMDGSELMIMDEDGRPLQLTACYVWETETVGDTLRPYRPDPKLLTKARLYPDGRLVLFWPQTVPLPELDSGVSSPGPGRVEVDLDVIDVYQARVLLGLAIAGAC